MTQYSSAIGNFTIGYSPIQGYPVIPPFPPAGNTSLTATIPSYLYQQYNSDDSLQAFVNAYNGITQGYVDWFANTNLPVYTGDPIGGSLLDWVAQGLYGMSRPVLTSGVSYLQGAVNTWTPNGVVINSLTAIAPSTFTPATDDVFKRVITWHFYKGDGKVFNVRWLKRRVNRFLYGYNGTDVDNDQTYRISVLFGLSGNVTITITSGRVYLVRAANPNGFALNTAAPNSINTAFVAYPPIPYAQTFKEAVENNLLEFPFQFTFSVVIS